MNPHYLTSGGSAKIKHNGANTDAVTSILFTSVLLFADHLNRPMGDTVDFHPGDSARSFF
jgi:hypothetical protein